MELVIGVLQVMLRVLDGRMMEHDRAKRMRKVKPKGNFGDC